MNWQSQVQEFEATFNYASSEDWQKTEGLKALLAAFRAEHPTEGLSMSLLDAIVRWKLRNQRGRTEARRKTLLIEPLWSRVTECVFSLEHHDADVLASVQVSLLSSLPGIGVGLATAILALTFPEAHGVIDFRVWKIVFQADKRSFTIQDYIHYLHELIPFAQSMGWSVQKADFMAWSYYANRRGGATAGL